MDPLYARPSTDEAPENTILASTDRSMVADLVEQRFYVFGGVARECLSTRVRFIKDREEEIKKILENFEKTDEVERLVDEKEGILAHHFICHYVPDPKYMDSYTVGEPSGYVKKWVVSRLLQLITTQETIAYLEKSPPAASYRGSLFEASVHEQFTNWRTIVAARQLDDSTREKGFNNENLVDICDFGSDFSFADLLPYHYYIPIKEKYAAVDAFYYSTSPLELLLFQTTVEKTHRLNGEALATLLEKLGLLGWVGEGKVSLIFVVPQDNVRAFRPLKIKMDDLPNEEDRVLKLNGISKAEASLLNKDGIETIGDLWKRVECSKVKEIKPSDPIAKCSTMALQFLIDRLAKYDEAKERHVVENIPLYVWGPDVKPCYLVNG